MTAPGRQELSGPLRKFGYMFVVRVAQASSQCHPSTPQTITLSEIATALRASQ